MANPDNVGGRDRLWDAILGEINLRTVKGAEGSDIETADRIRELCRAAPAGGDPARGKIDPSWSLFDRVDFALRDAGFDLDEAANIAALASGSAPAGSGEVENLALAVEAASNAFGPMCDLRHELLAAAALLRKLQQGADYVMVPREPTPSMCAAGFIVSEPEYDPAGVYRAMIAASQGQEGGHARD